MREIKFRAWDKKIKEMIRTLLAINQHFRLNDLFYSDKVIWMQFTGLQDKNGKEIYEGDIINMGDWKGVVTFSYGCFGIENSDKGFLVYADKWFVDNYGNPEVIGNIYENPEKLE